MKDGITFDHYHQKYRARAYHDGKEFHLGYWHTKAQAQGAIDSWEPPVTNSEQLSLI